MCACVGVCSSLVVAGELQLRDFPLSIIMTTIDKQEISEAYEEVRDDASSVMW